MTSINLSNQFDENLLACASGCTWKIIFSSAPGVIALSCLFCGSRVLFPFTFEHFIGVARGGSSGANDPPFERQEKEKKILLEMIIIIF